MNGSGVVLDPPVKGEWAILNPPGIVTGLRTMLKGAHIDDRDVRTEQFAGY